MERKFLSPEIAVVGTGAFVSKQVRPAGSTTHEVPVACTLSPDDQVRRNVYPDNFHTDLAGSPVSVLQMIGGISSASGPGNSNGDFNSGQGMVLTLNLTLQNAELVPITGARVDIWHCNKRGHCAGYNSAQNSGNWIAYSVVSGIQPTDSNGQINFTTVFPTWYVPRAIHFYIQANINGRLFSNRHWIPLPG